MEMKISINFSDEELLRSVKIVEDFLPYLTSQGMFFYFPFTKTGDREAVLKQINKDMMTYSPKVFLVKLENLWQELAPEILNRLSKFIVNSNEKIFTDYFCWLTMYGPYGYYDQPNKVYVNITKGNTEFMIETMLHEIIHLIVGQSSVNLSENIEGTVDALFAATFGDIFPNYYVQNHVGLE